jgi:glycosyltransferase involved in cell wall biosynthesis
VPRRSHSLKVARRDRLVRILIAAAEWFPDSTSGYARTVTETTRRLAELGHDVVALVPREATSLTPAEEANFALHRRLPRTKIPVTISDVAATGYEVRTRFRGAFDLMLAHSETSAVGLFLARRDLPLALVCHGPILRELRFDRARMPYGLRRLGKLALDPAFAVLEHLAMERSSCILVLSDFMRDLVNFDHHVRAKTRRVGGGVDINRFHPLKADARDEIRRKLGVDENARLALTVRRLEPRMGLDNLLSAMAMLRSRAFDLQLAVIGTGTMEGRLRGLTRDLNVASLVRFVGHVPDAELAEWYQASDLFVLPTIAYEGFGLVTAEALASGIPVVGTPVGATPELLVPLDRRLLSTDSSPFAIARAMEEAFHFVDEDLRQRCRRYALAHFAWEPVMAGWEAALESCACVTPCTTP